MYLRRGGGGGSEREVVDLTVVCSGRSVAWESALGLAS
jgi:hypothetical protein